MSKNRSRRFIPAIGAAVVGFSILGAGTATAAPGGGAAGHVYEATNNAAGNAIQVYDRAADGRLTPAALVATGGLGAGNSLGSQNGVVRDGDRLYAVNAGNNTVSTLLITAGGLVPIGTWPSGGTRPVSVTVHDDVVYVLNHDSDTITGFRVDGAGRLSPLANSTQPLTPNLTGGVSDAAQVSFSPDGDTLVVTEKASNTIDTFAVSGDLAQPAVPHASAGRTPFGFDFDQRGIIFVSEAGTGSASSYRVDRPAFGVVSAAVPDTQAAACWLVVSRDGRFAFAANTGSGTVSTYAVRGDGQLTLLAAVAGRTGAGPAELTLSPDSRSLHVRERTGALNSFAVGRDGSLTSLGVTQGAPTFGTSGLATD